LTDKQSQTLNSMNLLQAKEYYESLGFSVIPLIPGGKKPTCDLVFSKLQPDYAWAKAPPDANIGIRCGGKKHLVVLDCDDKLVTGTFTMVIKFLEASGFDTTRLPIVQTASKGGAGRHIYLQCVDRKTIKGHIYLLNRSYGTGEIRFGYMVYVAAPPSILISKLDSFGIGGTYRIISGSFIELPIIEPELLIQMRHQGRYG